MYQDHNQKNNSPPSMAGGFFIALFTIIGVVGGGLMGQPSIGLLIGIAVGLIAALGVWLNDRAKGRD